MNRFFIALVLVCLCDVTQAQYSAKADADSFNILNTRVRDQAISKDKAKKQAQFYLKKLSIHFKDSIARLSKNKPNYFPLMGYDKKAIGGTNGNGYQASSYSYWDGNAHLGHPAHDIFIADRNQDMLDDRSKEEVKVLAITSGVVVALADEWQNSSSLRGGKYLYIFDPVGERLFYYAHNNRHLVKVGDVIVAGTPIATVGRSGKNAFKTRSPTHLHLMCLRTDSARFLQPVNNYQTLISAHLKK
jgi:peptidoglycan LD-endopeptidase LytH